MRSWLKTSAHALALQPVALFASTQPADAGRGGRCGASMARIALDWKATSLPTVSEAGYDGREGDVKQYLASRAGEKPSIVFFFDPRDKKENDRIQSTVFGNEVVGTAARGFDLVKIDVTRIKREDLKAEYSKATPKFHFYSHTGDEIAKVEGGATLPEFTSAITKAFNAEFSMPLQKFLKAHRNVLDRIDRAEAQKARVAQKRSLLDASTRKDARAAALEKEIVREEKDAEEGMEKVLADEALLLDSLKLRPVAKD
jgi:hypothetical protein